MEGRLIYTIGHSNRACEEFLELLLQREIQALADVRRWPTSRWPQFRREHLAAELPKAGIEYHHLGTELGGFRGGYGAFTETQTFGQGLLRLEELGDRRRTAFMCAERFPWRCHRRFIARALEGRGWEVLHLIDRDRVWKPKKIRESRG